ncbi:MAG: RNA methyltransferase, partial [Candidatus Sumerlaeota bacterium]|nr:RNA methyltransferase [Candidatus Sumerlaeota bacterium]
QAGDSIKRSCGAEPIWVATSAHRYPNTISFDDLRRAIWSGSGRPVCLVFGTGWGLHHELVLDCDFILEPIEGTGDYNHLSVRSAASIIFHRLLG